MADAASAQAGSGPPAGWRSSRPTAAAARSRGGREHILVGPAPPDDLQPHRQPPVSSPHGTGRQGGR